MPRHPFILAIALLSAGSASCLSNTISDNGPPVIVITSPSTERVSGTITIKATVVDETGVDAVAFFVDDAKLVELRTEPYEYIWASTSVADGQHILRVTAKDVAGNSSVATRSMTVDNTPN
jgi:hypothetical protein